MRKIWVVLASIALVCSTSAIAFSLRRAAEAGAARLALSANSDVAHQLPVLWNAPEFALLDQNATQVTKSRLLDHVWIANFIFTRCTSVCPLLTARLRLLQRKLTGPDFRFVSFSVDPRNDTPEALRLYAEIWAKDETRWLLLHTEPDSLHSLTDGMRVVAQPSGDPANPILHTGLFFLIDRAGRVRGLYDSDDDRALQSLRSDADSLSAGGRARRDAPSTASSGKATFDGLGCAGCHDNAQLAPALQGIWGQQVSLADGSTAQVDANYIRQSIVAPSARLVAGYLDLMPSYADDLPTSQLNTLVTYVQSLSPPVTPATEIAGAATTSIVQDPMCGMSVRVTAETPHAVRGGREYYFCSDSCRRQFLAERIKATLRMTTSAR